MPALLLLLHRRRVGVDLFRVPTWCPFRLQFYCNGHSWLACQLTAAGIGFKLADNAFLHIDDWARARTLADQLSPMQLHGILDRSAKQCCPVFDVFAPSYHWSFMQVEYATDLVFRSQAVHPTPRPFAPAPPHQTRHRHLSLLSHSRRARRHRGWPPPR
jgi:hypothetical protein